MPKNTSRNMSQALVVLPPPGSSESTPQSIPAIMPILKPAKDDIAAMRFAKNAPNAEIVNASAINAGIAQSLRYSPANGTFHTKYDTANAAVQPIIQSMRTLFSRAFITDLTIMYAAGSSNTLSPSQSTAPMHTNMPHIISISTLSPMSISMPKP